jgi:hypothetical protein
MILMHSNRLHCAREQIHNAWIETSNKAGRRGRGSTVDKDKVFAKLSGKFASGFKTVRSHVKSTGVNFADGMVHNFQCISY